LQVLQACQLLQIRGCQARLSNNYQPEAAWRFGQFRQDPDRAPPDAKSRHLSVLPHSVGVELRETPFLSKPTDLGACLEPGFDYLRRQWLRVLLLGGRGRQNVDESSCKKESL
jgi:hypothetical protein